MRPLRTKDPIQPTPGAALGRGLWLDRCQSAVIQLEPHLAAADAFDLATDLWERPDCQSAAPELAVALLFSDQLRCLSCDLHAGKDFSILCSGAKTDRCPAKRVLIDSQQ